MGHHLGQEEGGEISVFINNVLQRGAGWIILHTVRNVLGDFAVWD